MDNKGYEAPEITVIGGLADITQVKPGFFFDQVGSSEGNSVIAPPGTPGTGSS